MQHPMDTRRDDTDMIPLAEGTIHQQSKILDTVFEGDLCALEHDPTAMVPWDAHQVLIGSKQYSLCLGDVEHQPVFMHPARNAMRLLIELSDGRVDFRGRTL
ncbi:hypothetical protein TKK_0000180 [Trichogramma kaykai]